MIVGLRDRADTEHELRADHVLMATGRRPVTAGLNLETVGVKLGDRSEVVTDEHRLSPIGCARGAGHHGGAAAV